MHMSRKKSHAWDDCKHLIGDFQQKTLTGNNQLQAGTVEWLSKMGFLLRKWGQLQFVFSPQDVSSILLYTYVKKGIEVACLRTRVCVCVEELRNNALTWAWGFHHCGCGFGIRNEHNTLSFNVIYASSTTILGITTIRSTFLEGFATYQHLPSKLSHFSSTVLCLSSATALRQRATWTLVANSL